MPSPATGRTRSVAKSSMVRRVPAGSYVELHLDPLGVGVLADVGQRLLGDAIKSQPAVASELTLRHRLPRSCTGTPQSPSKSAASAARRSGPGSSSSRSIPIAASCLFQAGLCQSMGALDGVSYFGVCAVSLGDQTCAFEVEYEAGKRVGQNIVHLAGEALPFAKRGGVRLCVAGLLELDDQLLGPVVLSRRRRATIVTR